MRISDWSSDVCSSDLELPVHAVRQLVEALVDGNLVGDHLLQARRPLGGQVEEQRLGGEVDLRARRRRLVLLEVAGIGLGDAGAEIRSERASCRERVCQYV